MKSFVSKRAMVALAFLQLMVLSSIADAASFQRFDGVYELTKVTGWSKFFRATACEQGKRLENGALDLRKAHCKLKEESEPAESQCDSELYVRGKNGYIAYSSDVDPASVNGWHPSVETMLDKNFKVSTCDDLNFLVCFTIKRTDFYDEEVNISQSNYVSKATIKFGFDKRFVSFLKTENELAMKKKEIKHYSGDKAFPDKMKEFDVNCHYQKIGE